MKTKILSKNAHKELGLACRFFLIFATTAFLTPAYAFEMYALKIEESFNLPVREISGLAWRTEPKSKTQELIVASDHSHDLYIIDWDSHKDKMAFHKVDVSLMEKGLLSLKTQWESVTADKNGRIFLVKESPAIVQVLSPELDKIEAEIHLKASDLRNPELKWNEASNSGAEGSLPLNNGHVLVVKEKDPIAILEFGPKDSKAVGFQSTLSPQMKEGFPVPNTTAIDLELKKEWRLDPQLELLMEDCSELYLSAQGDLYILSAQRGFIILLGRSLNKNAKTLTARKIWSLPSEISQPEGLVIDSNNRPIIAIDKKKKHRANLFILSPLNVK